MATPDPREVRLAETDGSDPITQSFTSAEPDMARRKGDLYTVVDGLYAIAHALDGVSSALRKLGTADASTPMGAMEMMSLEIKNGLEAMASAISDLKD